MPMQQLCEPPRDDLTEDQVRALLRTSPARTVTAGLELVDLGLTVLQDISDDLAGGTITRNSYADLHATAALRVTRELDWGAGLVRPYVTLSADGVSARFNLGVYLLSTPAHSLAESPPTFDVDGYDLLWRLRQPVGDAYGVPAGDAYLTRVEEILVSLGFTAYIIDQSAAGKTLPTPRAWPMDDRTTWLGIVNDLLASVGYAGIWSDWNGRLRAEAYQLPAQRAPEWTYGDDVETTMLGTQLVVQRDFFAAPNSWVFYRTNMDETTTPVDGNGVYRFANQSVGDTSVDARGGLVVTKVVGLDAADQASLIAQGQAIIAADMTIPTTISVPVALHPRHWHFDRLLMIGGVFPVADVQCTSWSMSLPPSTDDMQLELQVISQ